MTDKPNDLLQELSALLRRVSEQNDASVKRQGLHKLQPEEIRSNSQKIQEIFDHHRQEDLQFRERLLQTLEHHNQLLESLIARLKENPKKG